jgi:hypothetical protein
MNSIVLWDGLLSNQVEVHGLWFLLASYWLLGLLLNPEDGANTFLRKVAEYPKDRTVHPRRVANLQSQSRLGKPPQFRGSSYFVVWHSKFATKLSVFQGQIQVHHRRLQEIRQVGHLS